MQGFLKFVRPEDVTEQIPCGPDVDAIVDAVTALAAPAWLRFTARTEPGEARMGDRVTPAGVTFDVRAPEVVGRDGSLVRLVLRRNGEVAAQVDGSVLTHRVDQADAARGV